MPPPIIRGSPNVIVKPYEIHFDPRNGAVARQVFKAPGGGAALTSLYSAATSQGYRGRFLVSPVMSELEVETPDLSAIGASDLVADTWQMVGSEVSKNAFENDIIRNTINVNDRTVISRAIADNSKFDDAITALAADGITNGGGAFTKPTNAASLQLYKELRKGQDVFSFPRYVLRHTTICSSSSGSNVSDFNIEKLYTTSQLLAEVQNGALWITPLPNRLRVKILSIPTPTLPTDEAIYYLWSWKKLPSTETTTVNNRTEINTEYELDMWSTLRYGNAT